MTRAEMAVIWTAREVLRATAGVAIDLAFATRDHQHRASLDLLAQTLRALDKTLNVLAHE